ncbi:MAG: hypothetical protein PHR81_03240 [Bacteroidales bacterium]|jgi:hypothetical protein|nr:hypothetical protein [Bacteroidales bacterium]
MTELEWTSAYYSTKALNALPNKKGVIGRNANDIGNLRILFAVQ